MPKRAYRQNLRAASQARTRRRIVEATVHLHETLGPRATTISAIAERAGVQRLTVYRHFPDDEALFHACSSHWLAGHPLPDPATWREVAAWRPRCRAALATVYAYYRRNAGMLSSVMRDADLPAMHAPMRAFADFHRQTRDDLLAAVPTELARRRDVAATVAHALSFATWQALADDFDDEEMVGLALAWLAGVAARDRDAGNETAPPETGRAV